MILQQVPIVVVAEAVPVHPLPFVTVTVNEFAVLTEIVCVVAPVDQVYIEYPLPASRVVEPPVQIAVFPVIEGVGFGLTVVVSESIPVQPLPSVTVTVTVVAVLTTIVCVVAPVDQL